jgi:hypothetical protein
MSQKLKHQSAKPADNVVVLERCKAEGCKDKAEQMGFCKEHHDWFKWGMLTKEGKKPIDFDKKYQAFQKRKAA